MTLKEKTPSKQAKDWLSRLPDEKPSIPDLRAHALFSQSRDEKPAVSVDEDLWRELVAEIDLRFDDEREGVIQWLREHYSITRKS